MQSLLAYRVSPCLHILHILQFETDKIITLTAEYFVGLLTYLPNIIFNAISYVLNSLVHKHTHWTTSLARGKTLKKKWFAWSKTDFWQDKIIHTVDCRNNIHSVSMYRGSLIQIRFFLCASNMDRLENSIFFFYYSVSHIGLNISQSLTMTVETKEAHEIKKKIYIWMIERWASTHVSIEYARMDLKIEWCESGVFVIKRIVR